MDVPETSGSPESAGGGRRTPEGGRFPRTAVLTGIAAALGIAAGIGAGHLVPAGRATPAAHAADTGANSGANSGTSAEADTEADTEGNAETGSQTGSKAGGDLRELLLPRPADAQDALFNTETDGWLTLPEYAELYKQPTGAFTRLLAEEFRRAAVADWREGTYSVEIRLVQYRQEHSQGARESAATARIWSEDEAGTTSERLPDTADGRAYTHSEPVQESGAVPVYSAEAFAWRGDVAMEIWVYDSEPIPINKITDLANRQMRRL